MNKIGSIVIGKQNFISYEESTQGFHANQKDTIEEIKQHGADIIQVWTDFHEVDSINDYMRKVNRIVKGTGYKSTVGAREMKSEMGGVKKEWIEISGHLIKQ